VSKPRGCACSQCQLFSLSSDHVIKVWDLRTNKCTQTITADDWLKPEDVAPVAIAYDGTRKRLVTTIKKLCVWEHKLVMQDTTGHRGACVKAIYNSAFFVVVSADESVPPFPAVALRVPAWRRCWQHIQHPSFVGVFAGCSIKQVGTFVNPPLSPATGLVS
jgi:WD40 repeat protein